MSKHVFFFFADVPKDPVSLYLQSLAADMNRLPPSKRYRGKGKILEVVAEAFNEV